MAWPASKTTVRSQFDRINNDAWLARAHVSDVRAKSAAGTVDRRMLIDLQRFVDRFVATLDAAAALSQADRDALISYARGQFSDASIDVVAEFNSMRSAAVTLRDWIFANFPRDAATGAVLVETVDGNGNAVPLQFSSAQLSGFRTQADAFIATIS